MKKLILLLFLALSVATMTKAAPSSTKSGRDLADVTAEDDEEAKGEKEEEEEDKARKQAENANFSFGYSIQDGISDAYIERTEERKGLHLEGQYSYSDGYFMHTVRYAADDRGYRVTGMESHPVGDGPEEDPEGSAIVQQVASTGVHTQYAIRARKEEDEEEKEQEDRYVEIQPVFQEEEEVSAL